MKRDFDLIRKILLQVEEAPEGLAFNDLDEIYQVGLLIEAGLLKGKPSGPISFFGEVPPDAPKHTPAIAARLTWEGHDFLDAARDETLWAKVREKFLKPAGSMTFSVVLEWMKAQIRKGLGL